MPSRNETERSSGHGMSLRAIEELAVAARDEVTLVPRMRGLTVLTNRSIKFDLKCPVIPDWDRKVTGRRWSLRESFSQTNMKCASRAVRHFSKRNMGTFNAG